MTKWWIGCSGFSYKHWNDTFYKGIPQRKWFEYYCENFNTVELNVTFYRVPNLSVFQGWYARSPADFRFTVKAPRLITHYRKFKNAKNDIHNFYNIISTGLQEKLGSVLFQLHPGIQYSEENLEFIVNGVDNSYTNVIEFRHSSWWRDEVYKVLKGHKITFCGISYPGLPADVHKTASSIYYRFHGVPKLYLSSYNEETLNQINKTIKAYRGIKNVYAYFNNDIEVAAIQNAKYLMTL